MSSKNKYIHERHTNIYPVIPSHILNANKHKAWEKGNMCEHCLYADRTKKYRIPLGIRTSCI